MRSATLPWRAAAIAAVLAMPVSRELYYRMQLGRFTEITADVQHVVNPGYNRDRGPVTILGGRFNVRY